MDSYRAKPLSRKKIQCIAMKLRELLGVAPDEAFPIVRFMEFVLPQFDYTLEICMPSEMQDKYAVTLPGEEILRIREDVYINATKNNPRDLFTIAHEIGHVLFHNSNSIALARSNEKIKTYEDPEWQANTFAAELLAPSCMIKGKDINEIVEIYGCSKKVAKIQLSKA